eukprot:m.290903 g.290903  ORF g.290903 m.290903 type:complete len:794 (+) comp19472_c0_seq11:35-2416(+)
MDHYERKHVIGRGAYGVVWLCRRLSDNKNVIIKQIPVEEMTTEERQAALNEVRVLKILHNPNIIAYFDSFVEEKALMIVMEFAEGGTIFEYLQSREELLDEDEVMHLFLQMVISLQHVHAQNILHRDLKTQNIMLDKHQKVVKIGDFGISKVLSSKSKANTVVGTPCYISPELCEGKPYNQKSDIWALGCVLYELVSLQRAFDAPNLPALILKIMRGTIAPISDTYSEDLRKLILSMLHLDPNQRPRLSQILAQPICQNALLNMQTDIGRVPCLRVGRLTQSSRSATMSRRITLDPSSSSASASAAFAAAASGSSSLSGGGGLGAAGGGGSSVAAGGVKAVPGTCSDQDTAAAHTLVYAWGVGYDCPTQVQVPPDTQCLVPAVGRAHFYATASDGQLVVWKAPKTRHLSSSSLHVDAQKGVSRVPRVVSGLSGARIQHVTCGDSFAASLSDRGILMTFGNGSQGCLGHGDFDDVEQPRIVEALLGFEVRQISSGSAHIAAVTSENELFVWGSGANGRLGLPSDDTCCLPEMLPLAGDASVESVFCGRDCTIVVTTDHTLFGCGSNRYNKLGLLDHSTQNQQAGSFVSSQEAHELVMISLPPLAGQHVINVAMGTNHTLLLTETGQLYSLGSNQYGQLGRPAEAGTEAAGLVQGFEGKFVSKVACGDFFSVAVTRDNEVTAAENKGDRWRLAFCTQIFFVFFCCWCRRFTAGDVQSVADWGPARARTLTCLSLSHCRHRRLLKACNTCTRLLQCTATQWWLPQWHLARIRRVHDTLECNAGNYKGASGDTINCR